MARHSKWNNIKHQKAAQDARKGKVFTKHARLIAIAARNGADPGSNPLLRMTIDNAKAERVPNENIERAIKKGSGEGKDSVLYEEAVYEGFGPGGVAMLIEVLTDNKNRAVGNIRTTMGKRGGRMGEGGSVAWMFKKVGEIILAVDRTKTEEIELMAIDLGADDVQIESADEQTFLKIISTLEKFGRIRRELEEKGFNIDSSKLTYEASSKVSLAEESQEMADLERLIETLEEEDDVSEVFTNLE
jgi:YebC/PmpR family DNA-binding regulatory protein